MIKIDHKDLFVLFDEILLGCGFEKNNAELCSEIFTENTLVGVSSHGINRFPDFVDKVKSGFIKPNSKPAMISSYKAFEQWDGNLGPGPLNALVMTDRTLELANNYGIGCVALRNSNHWMRPGYFGWRAVEKGFILICWTNTVPIMPPWNGKDPTIGNNPIVLAVPRKDGNIVLDMAVSQYSYGKLENYIRENIELPYVGGYDNDDNPTKNPKEIIETQRTLPIGYWKGSGLSLLLDLITSILSGGKSTFDLGKDMVDSGMSQTFIAIDPQKFSSADIIDETVNNTLRFYLSSEQVGENEILYPGERIKRIRKQNLLNGIPVDEKIWEDIQRLKGNYE